MTDDLEARLRAGLRNALLPGAPETLRGYLADLALDVQPARPGRRQLRQLVLLGANARRMSMLTRIVAAAVITVVTVGGTLYLIEHNQSAVGGPSPTPGLSSSPSQPATPSAGPSSSEVQPRAASWTTTGSMTTPRIGHAATLLRDGRVLVAGGINKACYCADIVAYGSAELYDPSTGTWTATGSMLTHAGGTTLTLLLNGKVLAAGGGTSELYDPSTGTWTATGSMLTHAGGATLTLLLNGKVLAAGGTNGVDPLASAELYDPVSGTWTAAANMTRPLSDPTATLLADGKVLVVGDDPTTHTQVALGPNSAELYDPVTGAWTATGSMVATAGVNHATPLPDGKVLVFGYSTNGPGTGALSEELYDPSSGTWSVTGKMIGQEFSYLPTLLRNGKVLVTAGSAAQLYDPASGTWTVTASMVTQRFNETATLLSDGTVLVAGGEPGAAPGSAREAIASAELYDPGSP